MWELSAADGSLKWESSNQFGDASAAHGTWEMVTQTKNSAGILLSGVKSINDDAVQELT